MSASSSYREMKAFSVLSYRSARSMADCVNSTGEIFFLWIRSASSAIGRDINSSVIILSSCSKDERNIECAKQRVVYFIPLGSQVIPIRLELLMILHGKLLVPAVEYFANVLIHEAP